MTTVITDEWKFAMRGTWKIKSSLDAKKPCSCVINLSVPTCTYCDTAGFCQALCNLLPSLCQWLCGTPRQWVGKEHKTHFILTLRIKFYLYRYAQNLILRSRPPYSTISGQKSCITDQTLSLRLCLSLGGAVNYWRLWLITATLFRKDAGLFDPNRDHLIQVIAG